MYVDRGDPKHSRAGLQAWPAHLLFDTLPLLWGSDAGRGPDLRIS